MKKIIFCLFVSLFVSAVQAQTFNLLRSIASFSDGVIEDTADGIFTQNGRMDVVGDSVTQTITFCNGQSGVCLEPRIETFTINSVTNHNLRLGNGLVSFISTPPTIILAWHFQNGTVIIENWIPAGQDQRRNQEPIMETIVFDGTKEEAIRFLREHNINDQ